MTQAVAAPGTASEGLDFLVTIDVDWAPDWAVEWLATQLLDAGVRATWFLTHKSPATETLREHSDLFELGIHPNFLPGSTHGTSVREVLFHLLELVPEAISFRSHAVFSSGRVLEVVIQETPLKIESNCFLPGAEGLKAVYFEHFGGRLLKVPFFWADDYELWQPRPDWNFARFAPVTGLKVLNFHPIHVYFNCRSYLDYESLRREVGHFSLLSTEQAARLVREGAGARTFLLETVNRIRHGMSLKMADLLPL